MKRATSPSMAARAISAQLRQEERPGHMGALLWSALSPPRGRPGVTALNTLTVLPGRGRRGKKKKTTRWMEKKSQERIWHLFHLLKLLVLCRFLFLYRWRQLNGWHAEWPVPSDTTRRTRCLRWFWSLIWNGLMRFFARKTGSRTGKKIINHFIKNHGDKNQ